MARGGGEARSIAPRIVIVVGLDRLRNLSQNLSPSHLSRCSLIPLFPWRPSFFVQTAGPGERWCRGLAGVA